MRKFAAFAVLCAALAIPASATVTNATPPPISYSCNGVTTSFVANFPYLTPAHLLVTSTTAAGVATVLTLNTDFTVKPSIAPSTGTVTLTTACPSGSVLSITRNVPLTQPQSFRTGNYQGPVHEQAFDRLVMEIQQVDAKVSNPVLPSVLTNATPVLARGTTTPVQLQDWLVSPLNVKAFNAVGDGITDDSAAIQATINALPANGGEVYLPPGTYLVNTSLTSTKPSLTIRGAGGAGWSVGAATRIETTAAIIVFDFGTTATSELKGVHVVGLSVTDKSNAGAGGLGVGAFRVTNQWNALFRDVTVNGFLAGYCFDLEAASGGAVVLTRFESVKTRQNKLGVTTGGPVGQITGTNVDSSSYFSLSTPISGSIGVQMQDGQMDGAVDHYETGVKLVGDGARVGGRLEGNDRHVWIAGTTARRNIVMGARIISGGSIAAIQIDNNANIFDNVIVGNTYSAPAIGIVDSTVSPQNNYIDEPQQGTFFIRRQQTGTLKWEIRNSRNIANGDNVDILASAANGAVQGVLRAATGAPNNIQIGSATNQDVNIIRNGAAVLTLGSAANTWAGGFAEKRTSPTYGASVAINAALANFFSITATNGTAFTVANPTNAATGQRLTLTVRNTSGGALGVVTWDTLYKLSAWTSPANGFSRTIEFVYDGTNWVQLFQGTVDVPN